jgi:hypothetical protein
VAGIGVHSGFYARAVRLRKEGGASGEASPATYGVTVSDTVFLTPKTHALIVTVVVVETADVFTLKDDERAALNKSAAAVKELFDKLKTGVPASVSS